ncbi:MAG: hypothetical protein OEM17_01525 [Nitrosopumilus sp.]|nr:hypothetical protein [Nitrosopumilus sp.]
MEAHKPFKCENCSIGFSEEIELKGHYKKAHPTKYSDYTQRGYWENSTFP